MLHALRPSLIGLYPGNPHPLLSSLSHGDFQDRENEKSYAMHIGKHVDDYLTTPLHHAKHGWPLFLRCTTAPFAFESASATFSSLGLHHLRMTFMASNHIGFVALYFV